MSKTSTSHHHETSGLSQKLHNRRTESGSRSPRRKRERPTPVEQETFSERWDRRVIELANQLSLVDLNNEERAFLATCQQLYRSGRGCHTPFEKFFASIVRSIEHEQWLDPDDIRHELEEFDEDFVDMRHAASRFISHYPGEKTDAEVA